MKTNFGGSTPRMKPGPHAVWRHLIAGVAGLVLLAGSVVPAGADDEGTYRQLKLLGDAIDLVRSYYVEEVSDQELVKAAIDGMLTHLDPHSRYLDPKTFRDMEIEQEGQFGGLGIEVTMENGLVKVIAPIDDTPAQRAGVEAGDVVTHLDGEPVMGLTLEEAVEKMRGPPDSEITLTIVRGGLDEALEIAITRAIIKLRSVRAWVEKDDILVLRVSSFAEPTSGDLEDTVGKLSEERGSPFTGAVLDLRNNPGGLLSQAVEISDAFLDQGEIVSIRGRGGDGIQRFYATEGDVVGGVPLVVLINNGSASASEIVAGAVQDHERGVVMGTRSFGKGSVQTVFPFNPQEEFGAVRAQYFRRAVAASFGGDRGAVPGGRSQGPSRQRGPDAGGRGRVVACRAGRLPARPRGRLPARPRHFPGRVALRTAARGAASFRGVR